MNIVAITRRPGYVIFNTKNAPLPHSQSEAVSLRVRRCNCSLAESFHPFPTALHTSRRARRAARPAAAQMFLPPSCFSCAIQAVWCAVSDARGLKVNYISCIGVAAPPSRARGRERQTRPLSLKSAAGSRGRLLQRSFCRSRRLSRSTRGLSTPRTKHCSVIVSHSVRSFCCLLLQGSPAASCLSLRSATRPCRPDLTTRALPSVAAATDRLFLPNLITLSGILDPGYVLLSL